MAGYARKKLGRFFREARQATDRDERREDISALRSAKGHGPRSIFWGMADQTRREVKRRVEERKKRRGM